MTAGPTQTLKLLTYNIQSGSYTCSYREYLTKSWKQLLPHRNQASNLDQIARLLQDFDIVGLQEVDGGSLRSGFVNQTAYLAEKGNFDFWFTQPNRNIGQLGQHSNGLLSRFQPSGCMHMRLPGLPGRGMLVAEFAYGAEVLAIMVVHLALGGRSQKNQIDYILKIAEAYPHTIILGDFNRSASARHMRKLTQNGYRDSCLDALTYPSWNPRRKIDHIFVSEHLLVSSSEVVEYHFSDHLPIRLTVNLPETVCLQAEPATSGQCHGQQF